MSLHALSEELFSITDRVAATEKAQAIACVLDKYAAERDYLALSYGLRMLNYCLREHPTAESVYASSLCFAFTPEAAESLLQQHDKDPQVVDAIVANMVEHKCWRHSPKSMEQIIRDLAWRGQHESIIAILDSIITHSTPDGQGLDLIQVATEFSLERDDYPIQEWVSKNEERLVELDAEGGISGNAMVREGISWHQKGVMRLGMLMATRNPSNASGQDLLDLEVMMGQFLNYPGNPTGYKDDWLFYLLLTPYSIDQYAQSAQSFDHATILKTLEGIRQTKHKSTLSLERVHLVARYDVLALGKSDGKAIAKALGDYRKAGFPLPKAWVRKLVNELAIKHHQDIEALSETLRVAKSHGIKIDFDPFLGSFHKALTAANRSLSYRAGMTLIQAFKDDCPIPPRFFGTWFKRCSAKWSVDERANFLQAAPHEVLQASDRIRDSRMASDLGL